MHLRNYVYCHYYKVGQTIRKSVNTTVRTGQSMILASQPTTPASLQTICCLPSTCSTANRICIGLPIINLQVFCQHYWPVCKQYAGLTITHRQTIHRSANSVHVCKQYAALSVVIHSTDLLCYQYIHTFFCLFVLYTALFW